MASVFTHSAAAGRRQPIAWFDTRLGMAADCSTWASRVGKAVATQPDAGARFVRVNDARPNWLETSFERSMQVDIDLQQCQELTVLAAVRINEPSANRSQEIVHGPDCVLYSNSGNVEFFVSEFTGSSYGSNPIAPLANGQYTTVGGDVKVGRYPSSRSFVNNVLNSDYNRRAQRTQPFSNGTWTLGNVVGRLRHILIFPYVLTDAERAYWTTRLNNTLP